MWPLRHLASWGWRLISPLKVAALFSLLLCTLEEDSAHVWTFFARCELHAGQTAWACRAFNLRLLRLLGLPICTWRLVCKLEEFTLLALGTGAAEEVSAGVRPFLSYCALSTGLTTGAWRFSSLQGLSVLPGLNADELIVTIALLKRSGR